MSIQSWLKKAEERLCTGPHPERARADAELLLMHASARGRAFLLAHPEEPLEAEAAARFEALVARRVQGEPIQHITGEQEFFGLPFEVSRDVLIPRPETEHLVERALELAARWPRPRIVDVGCGSGAIAVAVAYHLPQAQVTAIDLSPQALAIAQHNAARNAVEARIQFLEGDLLAPVAGERFELVLSNPPYVAEVDRKSLSVEVRDFEPEQALFAGPDGLEIYKRLIPQAFAVLTPGGYLLLELGAGQRAALAGLLTAAGFPQPEFIADLQGIPRVAVAQREP